MFSAENPRICVVGLGYVGLPLAVAFADHFDVIGFDISKDRIAELRNGHDRTREVKPERLKAATGLKLTTDETELSDRDFFVITVPTPIDEAKRPDLSALRKASEMVGRLLKDKAGACVVYESTVYPGCTQEICVPILKRASGLEFNEGFFCGYSPERANPGDEKHTLATIDKVTSGSTAEVADKIAAIYSKVLTTGSVHRAPSIAVAEAAKVLENTQRDLNIALINEVAMICHRLGIDTAEVLAAARTKWNFLDFKPGLVGGHCIGVDPYYLTHKAQEVGHHPEMILAGRRVNDSMGAYVAGDVLRLMLNADKDLVKSKVLILGMTFKEDCPDLRNSKVMDVVASLVDQALEIEIYDPLANPEEAREYLAEVRLTKGVRLTDSPETAAYGAVVLAVAHKQFKELGGAGIREFCKPGGILYDVKSVLGRDEVDGRL